MPRMRIEDMPFERVYPLLVQKAERKGRTKQEVDTLACWLTGYTPEDIEEAAGITYGDFFRKAPRIHPNAALIKGRICGIRVEEIEDPLMRNIRCLDKLVDDLAKGKSVEKILCGIYA